MNIEENKSRPIGSDKAPVSGQKVMPKGEHNNRAGMRHFPKELPSLKTFSLQGLFTPVGSTLMYIWQTQKEMDPISVVAHHQPSLTGASLSHLCGLIGALDQLAEHSLMIAYIV